MGLPLVSALMATQPSRRHFAVAAIEDFARQTYDPRELVIVVAAEEPQATVAALQAQVAQLQAAGFAFYCHVLAVPSASCGEVRQAALAAASGDFVVLWDDDDRSHCRRLETQVHCAGLGAGSALAHGLVLDRRANTFTVVSGSLGPPGGLGGLLPATLLWRRALGFAYQTGGPAHEEELFLHVASKGAVIAVAPAYLVVKQIHHRNTRDPDQLRRWVRRHKAALAPGRPLETFRRELGGYLWSPLEYQLELGELQVKLTL